jgi:hypothetical protein
MMRKLLETALAAINTVASEDKKSSALRRVIKNTCADITTQFMLANWKIGGNENQRNMTFNSDSIASL